MSTKTFKISYSLIFIILIALYVGLFFVFVPRPFSVQQRFFLVLIPVVLVVDCIAGVVLSSLKDTDLTLISAVPVARLQILYTCASVATGVLLALFCVAMKTQIVIQIVIISVLLIGYVVLFYVASHVSGVKREQNRVKNISSTKEDFRLAVVTMESVGLDDGRCTDLKRLCDDFIHTAPCNDVQAIAIESQISEELKQMISEGPGGFDKHFSKVKFLVKRRSMLRSN